jgi:ankyrin repeat protein
LQAKVDFNACDERGRTALMEAAENGKLDVVRVLLENGACVELKDQEEKDALALAKSGRDNARGISYDPHPILDQSTHSHIERDYRDIIRLLTSDKGCCLVM